MENHVYNSLLNILKEELVPATGCTEPISVAYASAIAREVLGCIPSKVEITVSGNILKNVKSVVVPNTGGLRGIPSAVASGIIAGDAQRKLDVLSTVKAEDIPRINEYLNNVDFSVKKSQSGCVFDIEIAVFSDKHSASVRIVKQHTNVVSIIKDGVDILKEEFSELEQQSTDTSSLTIYNIVQFANEVKIDDVAPTINRQIECNFSICNEGLTNNYGAKIGKTLLSAFGNGVQNRAKATAAAGSDARMNGCNLPVVIVSGSGNQGITASMPVLVYAKELNVDNDKLIRALVVSNLVTVRLKSGIGKLSAYCGAVSAGCGAGAGICYLLGGSYDEIERTVVNALAINSGVICDGAKSSCAAKIASAVDAGLIGLEMSRKGNAFYAGDGILADDVEETIDNVGDIARIGMHETDEQIIDLMLSKTK